MASLIADFISSWTPGLIMRRDLATPVAPVACSRAYTWVVLTTPRNPAPRLVDSTNRPGYQVYRVTLVAAASRLLTV